MAYHRLTSQLEEVEEIERAKERARERELERESQRELERAREIQSEPEGARESQDGDIELFRQLVHGQTDKQTDGRTDITSS